MKWMLRLGLALGFLASGPSRADVVIPYNEYSASPTIGRGTGTSTDPRDVGYGAVRIFIEKVATATRTLPAGQKVTFVPDPKTHRAVSALRAGVQFGSSTGENGPAFSDPSWGFIYNSVPFGTNFEQMLTFLYDAKVDSEGRNGMQLAQAVLDARGGTQIVFPIVGSTMQGSGYFPSPIGPATCEKGDADCAQQAGGIGLAGLCTSGWRIRYLSPPQDIIERACDILVERGHIPKNTLTFYPPVGGQSVLLPMQRRAIQGFEYVNPSDDFVDFFPIKNATEKQPLGNPDAGDLDCGEALPFPISAGTQSSCSQNIGQIGARFAHYPSWHQPFLLSWMHVDKGIWAGLNPAQRSAILTAARESVVDSYKAAESIQCRKLQDMIDINEGLQQRNTDGSPRPVSAKITLARWPEEALAVLKEATDDYFEILAGANVTGEKTDAHKDFAEIAGAWRGYVKDAGAETFTPGRFPAGACAVAP